MLCNFRKYLVNWKNPENMNALFALLGYVQGYISPSTNRIGLILRAAVAARVSFRPFHSRPSGESMNGHTIDRLFALRSDAASSRFIPHLYMFSLFAPQPSPLERLNNAIHGPFTPRCSERFTFIFHSSRPLASGELRFILLPNTKPFSPDKSFVLP